MERNNYTCKVCNKNCDDGNERIYCMGPYHQCFHAKCVGFTPAPLKFYKSCGNLFYECDDCSDNPTRMIGVTLNKLLSCARASTMVFSRPCAPPRSADSNRCWFHRQFGVESNKCLEPCDLAHLIASRNRRAVV